MLIRITEIERLNSSCGFDRRRQRLWSGRNELHFQRVQFIERLVHVSYDNGDMLKPKIIALRIHRNGSARRGQILGQIEIFLPELHPHDPHPRTENAFEVFKLFAENFNVRNFLKGERRIKLHRAVHITYGHAY